MTDPDRDGKRTVEIPAETAAAVAARLDGTEFESVDDYVAFALAQLLRQLEGADEPGSSPNVATDVEADGDGEVDDAVAERLESLGYR